MIHVDTNVLIRFSKVADPGHGVAFAAIHKFQADKEDLVVFPQTFYEFWAVTTRPLNVNGLGWTTPMCETRIAELKPLFRLLPDPPGLYDTWQQLVIAHDCKGKVAHDTRLVAAMQLHGINRILTFNIADFARFPTITVVEPASVTP